MVIAPFALKQRGDVELFSRRGNSFNAAYPGFVTALLALRAKSFVLDGELVAIDDAGRHSFSLLQNAKSRAVAVHFYVFDLLHFDGENLLERPLAKRREMLEEVFLKLPAPIEISPLLAGSLSRITGSIRQSGFEGIVAKRKDSIYRPGEEPGTWVKNKMQPSEDFTIGGYVPGTNGIDQLVVGVWKEGSLHFVDSVKNAFVPTTRRKVQEAIAKLAVPDCPFVNLPEKKRPHALDREKMKTVRWVRPKTICEIVLTNGRQVGICAIQSSCACARRATCAPLRKKPATAANEALGLSVRRRARVRDVARSAINDRLDGKIPKLRH